MVWLIPHHFGGSLHCYVIRNFSLREFGFYGYLLVIMFDILTINYFLV